MTIGYIGVGNMGGALARRLLLRHALLIHDAHAAAVQRMVDLGAVACATPADLAAQCDMILLCLPSSEYVREVIFGVNGIAATARPGTTIIDQTTADPTATRAMAAELAARGLDLIDAPVSGGPASADAGTVAIMVGATPEQYQSVQPILAAISPNLFHAGGVGCANFVKLANNLLSATQALIALEAVALAVKNGIEPHKAVEIMRASSGRNFFLENALPKHILTGQLEAGYALSVVQKDVRMACRLGRESGMPMLFGNLASNFLHICVNEVGRDAPGTSIALVMDRLAGTSIVPKAPPAA